MLIDGATAKAGDFALLINMWHEAVTYTLPGCRPGFEWRRIVDTAAWAESTFNFWPLDAAVVVEDEYAVHAYSIVVLEQAQTPECAD